jgi:peptidoglycan hydrolase-like protein with peptidoglycan-binding domain
LLVFFLLGVPGIYAEAHRTAKQTANSSKKKKSSRRSKSARTRRSAPRQRTPTAERYMEIQQALAERGHYTGPIDGKWSPECIEALKKFQTEQQLEPDGKLGALSIIALGLGPKREPITEFVGKPGTDQ